MTYYDPDPIPMPTFPVVIDLLGVDVLPDIDDALLLSRPDIEHHVWRTVSHLSKANLIAWVYGGAEVDQMGWATTTFVQVESKGHTRQRAFELGDRCRRLVKALPWIRWDDGVVCSVDCLDGPRWMPDDDGKPRYIARYAIVHHPHQRRAVA